MAKTTFAARITEQRKAHGLSQKQAAADLGISQALLSHYENGVRECGLGFVVKAAEFYGVSCDYLLGRTANEVLFRSRPGITDLPEDSHWTTDTILRSALVAGGYATKDKEMEQFVKTIYSLATYFTIYGGVYRRLLPESWLGNNSTNIRQFQFLMNSFTSALRDMTPKDMTPRAIPVPASVSTITAWTNDYLNLQVADIL